MKPQPTWLRVSLILLTFILTGMSLARIGAWVAAYMEWPRFSGAWWGMWVGLLPLYYVILLLISFPLGQYPYFRKKIRRMKSLFSRLFSSK